METLPSPKKSTLLLGVLILLVVLFVLATFGGKMLLWIYDVKATNAIVFFSTRILFWSPLLLIFIYARKVEKQKLLIWEERKYKFWQYLVSCMAIFFAIFVGLIIIGTIVIQFGFEKESAKLVQLLKIFRENQWLIFLTAATAGIVEELTFRGYLQPRMTILFKSPWLAIFLSSVLFGLLHLSYGTLLQVIGPFLIGFILAIYYYKFRNIKVIIICHFLWDVMAIYGKLWLESLKDVNV